MKNAFINQCCNEDSAKWKDAIHREIPIYSRNNDIRSEFERDYTRILHSEAYRRLKHKTQVFFAPHNDHICTRMEHVMHVASVASTIAKYLGLNDQLTSAIQLSWTLTKNLCRTLIHAKLLLMQKQPVILTSAKSGKKKS